MAKSDDLLLSGVVTQDPDRLDRVVYNVPLYLPKVALDNGVFEAFASAYGWTPTVLEDELEIANPLSAHEKSTEVIWNFVREVFTVQMLNQAQATAREQAVAQVKTILS